MPAAKHSPEQLLKLVFARIEREPPTEIRFVSGMAPELVYTTGPRFLKVAYLTTEVVQALHQLCLTWAEQSGILSRASARYRVALPEFGRFRCEYRFRADVAALTLRPYLPEEDEVGDGAKPVERNRKASMNTPIDPARLIDDRIAALGDWRGEMLARLRALIKQADPKVVEEWKWSVPVWSRDGILCTGETYKKAVKLTFAKGAALPDPSRLFNSSLDGNTRRAIDFKQGDKIDEKAFKALIRAAAAHNAAK